MLQWVSLADVQKELFALAPLSGIRAWPDMSLEDAVEYAQSKAPPAHKYDDAALHKAVGM